MYLSFITLLTVVSFIFLMTAVVHWTVSFRRMETVFCFHYSTPECITMFSSENIQKIIEKINFDIINGIYIYIYTYTFLFSLLF